jgi:hypothetical protein
MGLTDAFNDQSFIGLNARSHFYSQAKDYVVGPMAAVNLPFGLGVEFDALYRPGSPDQRGIHNGRTQLHEQRHGEYLGIPAAGEVSSSRALHPTVC